MDAQALREIVQTHSAWLAGMPGGKRADLRGADLREADLRGANLRGADLREAVLRGADLRWADLRGADLGGADLRGADLRWADLRGALLGGADLRGANLSEAILSEADLRECKIDPLAAARLSILPDSGDVAGWKKCQGGILVKLLIPDGVPRSNATGRKCRAKSARVLEVIGADVGISMYDSAVVYRAGETVECHEWREDRWQECAGGIHFYITRAEAEAHQ